MTLISITDIAYFQAKKALPKVLVPDCINRRLEDNTISLLHIAKFDIILSIEILY